jgi:lysophospholipase L1-like esterase
MDGKKNISAWQRTWRNYLMIGDSISKGALKSTAARLQEHGIHTVHNPTNAANVVWGKNCLSDWLGTTEWDAVSVNFGLHDLSLTNERVEPSVYRALLSHILSTIALKLPQAKIILVTTTPAPSATLYPPRRWKDVRIYNLAALGALRDAGLDGQPRISLLDLYKLVEHRCGRSPYLDCPRFQQKNNVHFTEDGYEFIGEAYSTAVLSVL